MSRLLAKCVGALAVVMCVAIAHDSGAASVAKQYKAPAADTQPHGSTPTDGEADQPTPPAPRKRPLPSAAGSEAAVDHAVLTLQCDWLGKRIISLLVRDDPDAADDFVPFYQRFTCAEEHLSKAFGCAVANLDEIETSALAELVDACWKDPSVRMVPAEPEAKAEKGEKGDKSDKSESAGGKPGEPAAKTH